MKSILCVLPLLLLCTTSYSQTLDDYNTDKQLNGVWWNYTSDKTPAYMKNHFDLKGAMISFQWSDLQPSAPPSKFNWSNPICKFDLILKTLSAAGFKICLLIYTGPAAPDWLYNAPYNVPKYTNTDMLNYPDYLNTTYQTRWQLLLDSVLRHISLMDTDVKSKITIFQSCEGTTGDEGPWHGTRAGGLAWPYDSKDSSWVIMRDTAWASLNRKLKTYFPAPNKPSGSAMTMLVNPGNPSDLISVYSNFLYSDTANRKLNHTWLKAGSVGHGYQLNTEDTQKIQHDPYINTITPAAPNRTRVRSRSEMDEFNGWFLEAPKWNYYWLSINAVYFGLDCWINAYSSLSNPDYLPGFNFFNKYAGLKYPDSTDKGFCALRDGLDASDFTRFPSATYLNGDINTFSIADSSRAQRIVTAFASYGAKQEDYLFANGPPMKQRKATAMNDVGWDIFSGNYERFIRQINVPTGVYRGGYWRKGPFVTGTTTPKDSCGRFAKGFDSANSINNFYFDVNDSLNLTNNSNGSKKVALKITYLDEGLGNSWALIYYKKIESTFIKITTTITNTNVAGDSSWKVYTVNVDSFGTKNQIAVSGGSNADIQLQNVGTSRQVFHMIEISNQVVLGARLAATSTQLPKDNPAILVYPNPDKGIFTVRWNRTTNLPASIRVMNTQGSTMYLMNKVTAESVLVNIADKPAGVYYIEVMVGKDVWRSKVIKE